jgi:hypothetical protein
VACVDAGKLPASCIFHEKVFLLGAGLASTIRSTAKVRAGYLYIRVFIILTLKIKSNVI